MQSFEAFDKAPNPLTLEHDARFHRLPLEAVAPCARAPSTTGFQPVETSCAARLSDASRAGLAAGLNLITNHRRGPSLNQC
jgi:hypothetical protein